MFVRCLVLKEAVADSLISDDLRKPTNIAVRNWSDILETAARADLMFKDETAVVRNRTG